MQGNDHSYGYPPFYFTEWDTIDNTRPVTHVPHYSYVPSEVWRDSEGDYHDLSGQTYPIGDTPAFMLLEPPDPDPMYRNNSLEVWRENDEFSRCATYPGGPAYLTNISIPLSQVSYLHPPWRFVAIRSKRHTGIDLISPRTNF